MKILTPLCAMIGKKKMKDWKACVRTWEKNDAQKTKRIVGGAAPIPGKYDHL